MALSQHTSLQARYPAKLPGCIGKTLSHTGIIASVIVACVAVRPRLEMSLNCSSTPLQTFQATLVDSHIVLNIPFYIGSLNALLRCPMNSARYAVVIEPLVHPAPANPVVATEQGVCVLCATLHV